MTRRERPEANSAFAPPLVSALGWRLVSADVRDGVVTFSDFVERAFAIAFDQAASSDERCRVLSRLDESMRAGSTGKPGTHGAGVSLDTTAHVLQAAMKKALVIRIQTWSELLLYRH